MIDIDRELKKIQAEEYALLTWKVNPSRKEIYYKRKLEENWTNRNLTRAVWIERYLRKVPTWKKEDIFRDCYQIKKRVKGHHGGSRNESHANLSEVVEHPT